LRQEQSAGTVSCLITESDSGQREDIEGKVVALRRHAASWFGKKLKNPGFLPISTLMSSVTSVNPGVADLFHALSNTGSASVSSPLSLPGLQSALQTASPVDIVQLSQQALALQQVSGLFGTPDAFQTSTDPSSLLLQALTSSVLGSTTPVSTASLSTGTTQAAASALEQALFGTIPNVAA
jgi:hypothetical protein